MQAESNIAGYIVKCTDNITYIHLIFISHLFNGKEGQRHEENFAFDPISGDLSDSTARICGNNGSRISDWS